MSHKESMSSERARAPAWAIAALWAVVCFVGCGGDTSGFPGSGAADSGSTDGPLPGAVDSGPGAVDSGPGAADFADANSTSSHQPRCVTFADHQCAICTGTHQCDSSTWDYTAGLCDSYYSTCSSYYDCIIAAANCNIAQGCKYCK